MPEKEWNYWETKDLKNDKFPMTNDKIISKFKCQKNYKLN